MKRRDFFKHFGVGTVAVAIPPTVMPDGINWHIPDMQLLMHMDEQAKLHPNRVYIVSPNRWKQLICSMVYKQYYHDVVYLNDLKRNAIRIPGSCFIISADFIPTTVAYVSCLWNEAEENLARNDWCRGKIFYDGNSLKTTNNV